MRRQHWRLYALGGGLGHLTRASALARAAVARGHAVELLTNSPFAPGLPLESLLGPGAVVHRLDARLDKPATVAAVTAWLTAAPCDVLVVDTFPRGLAGELAALLPTVRAPRVLVHRDLNPVYVERFDVAARGGRVRTARRARRGRALRAPPARGADRAVAAAGRGRPAAARGGPAAAGPGGVGLARPVVAVLGCGRPEEVVEAGATAARLRRSLGERAEVRWLVPTGAETPGALAVWPALAVLPGVDVLVGSGGYNTVQEARATGTPLVAWARSRLYDRQALRLTGSERVVDAVDLEARVQPRALLEEAGPSSAPLPT